VEKIERQNSYAIKDKMEVQYQLRDISKKTQGMLANNGKYLKVLISLQVTQLAANNADLIPTILKFIL
jgi:hypothetical protein